ncbi:unnamed protein product [Caenorhabditis nigoni]
MANCLMQLNQCGFPNCAQHFANQYDLTAHIEYTHIPVIEEDVKRKKIYAANSDQPMPPPAMNLPLSYYSRVFRTAYRPNPIKPEPLKLSFNHYKKRTIPKERSHSNPNATRYYRDMMARQGRHMLPVSIEEAEKRLCDIDFEECGADNPEVRWQCAIVDCNKRYKSMFALRVHMKMCHNVVVSEEAKSLTSYPSEDVKPNLAALQQAMQQSSQMNPDRTMSSGTPTSTSASNTPAVQGSPHPGGPSFGNPATNTTAFKCSYCSKRYKTSSGLSNHMMSSHQKISEAQDVPSQLVVEQLISQARMQRNQEGSSSGGQSPQKHVSSPSQHFQSVANGSSHARNFSVTTTQQPIRFSQPGFPLNLDNQPSTGQVLQMQMQHEKRQKQIQEMKKMQELQAAQALASSQQQQSQQGQQGQHFPSHVGQTGQNSGQSSSNQHPQMGQFQQQPQQQSQLQQQHQHQQQQQHNQQLQQQQHQQQQQQQQQYHQVPSQHHQQQSPYPQHVNQVAQHSPHAYQQHQQSPQLSQYSQASQSPQQQHANGPLPPPQRSPIPQPLPPLSSMTQQQRMPVQQMPSSNSGPMQFSSPNSQGYHNMMPSPSNGQLTPSQQPPPYNP